MTTAIQHAARVLLAAEETITATNTDTRLQAAERADRLLQLGAIWAAAAKDDATDIDPTPDRVLDAPVSEWNIWVGAHLTGDVGSLVMVFGPDHIKHWVLHRHTVDELCSFVVDLARSYAADPTNLVTVATDGVGTGLAVYQRLQLQLADPGIELERIGMPTIVQGADGMVDA